MISIRNGTFETNSSSCHSVTIFKDPKDWEDFKNHKTFIRECMYDINEHTDIFNIIDSDNRLEYIKTFDEIYDIVKDSIEHPDESICRRGYNCDEKDVKIFNYLRKNISKELLFKILTGNDDEEIVKLDTPITITYGSGYQYTYENLKVYDFYDFLFGYGNLSSDLPKIYIYGNNGDWEKADVKEYIEKNTNESLVLVTRNEEC